jgi:hypothetical protein
MRQVLEGQDFTTGQEFVAALNRARLQNPKSWFTYGGLVNGREVALKSYNTGYLQILRVNGITHPAPMDMNVGSWKNFIIKAIG